MALALLFALCGAALLADAGRRVLHSSRTPVREREARAGRRAFMPAPTPDALEVLAQVRADVIPPEESPTAYGVTFSAAGYQTLLSWNQSIRPQPAWAGAYEAVDITLPCCEAAHPFRDETQNCGCGHHQATYGVTKYLLGSGYSTEAAQAEVDRWKAYMFPRETLAAEMERRALGDPAIRRALDELKEKGEC